MSQPNSSSSTSAQDLPSVDALRAVYAYKQVGDLFEFGRYSQEANGESEPITWRVLQREEDYLLVISEQGLDSKRYHEQVRDVTWADCTLRRWLNSEFMNVAFNEQERECILKTSVVNNAGPNTEDSVFLLSVDEAKSFFANKNDACCQWWLRSRGFYGSHAAYVETEGYVSDFGKFVNNVYAVRPTIKLAFEHLISSHLLSFSLALRQWLGECFRYLLPRRRPVYVDKCVGESFKFGRYPQGANGEVEPITWRVLQREKDYLLVIAEQGLECKPYHEMRKITWEACTLRRWLNSEFMSQAFNEQERECILKTSIVNNVGPNTDDYVFLLSVDEVASLFANKDERCAKQTEYAVNNIVYTSRSEGAKYECNYWWLRSSSVHSCCATSCATCVDAEGCVGFGYRVNHGHFAVRPALKLAFSASLFFPSPESTGTPVVAQSSASSASPSSDVYANVRVGEYFEFGRYPRGANGEIKPITWRVLQREADHLLVIAEQGLDCKPYHEMRKITWEACTLRRWLNSEFYEKAFNEQEHKCILQTSVVNNVGPKTDDYIFLLSVGEARSLFAKYIERRTKPSGYAAKNGVATSWAEDDCCEWWLRSSGIYAYYAAYVMENGGVIECGNNFDCDCYAVRPAFRIALPASSESASAEKITTPVVAQYVASPASPLRAIYADKRVGECFEFGHYPQGANGEIEPITWMVLQREADYILIIAEQCLDCKPYNEELSSVTWADCTLRDWLNSRFYDEAFNEQERKCILQTSIVNNVGTKTEDFIFLLSVDEAESLFADDELRFLLLSVDEAKFVFANDELRCAKPTEYAAKNGVWTWPDDDRGFCWWWFRSRRGNCAWWLRSRGDSDTEAAFVGFGGCVRGGGTDINRERNAVRPALKLAL